MKLNFGKYKGQEISEIQDTSYLTWIVNFPNEGKFQISQRIKDEARETIQQKGVIKEKPLQEIMEAIEPIEVSKSNADKVKILMKWDEMITIMKEKRAEIAEM